MPQMMIAENLSINSFKIKKDNSLNELNTNKQNKVLQNNQSSPASTTVNNNFYDTKTKTTNNTKVENCLKKSVFKFAPPAIINHFDSTTTNINTKLINSNNNNKNQLQIHKFIPPILPIQAANTSTKVSTTNRNNNLNNNESKTKLNNMNENKKFKSKTYQNQFQINDKQQQEHMKKFQNSKMSSHQQQQYQQQQLSYKSQTIINPSYRSQIPIPVPAKINNNTIKNQPQMQQQAGHYVNCINYDSLDPYKSGHHLKAFNSKTNLPLIDMIIKNTEANRVNFLYNTNSSHNHNANYKNITKSTNNLNSHNYIVNSTPTPSTPTSTNYSNNLNSTRSNTSTSTSKSTENSKNRTTNLKKTASTPQLEKENPKEQTKTVDSNLPVLIPLPLPFMPNYSMTLPKQIPSYVSSYNQYKNFSLTLSKSDTSKVVEVGATSSTASNKVTVNGASNDDALSPLVVKLESNNTMSIKPLTSTPITSTPNTQTAQSDRSQLIESSQNNLIKKTKSQSELLIIKNEEIKSIPLNDAKPPIRQQQVENKIGPETASSSSLSKQIAKVVRIDQSSPPMPKLKLSLIPSNSSCSLKAILPRKGSADNLDEPEQVIDLNIDFTKKNKPIITANKLPTSAQITTQVVSLNKQPSKNDIYDKHINHQLKSSSEAGSNADLKLKSLSLHSIEKTDNNTKKVDLNKPKKLNDTGGKNQEAKQKSLNNLAADLNIIVKPTNASMPPLPKIEKTNRLLLNQDLKQQQQQKQQQLQLQQQHITTAKSTDKLNQKEAIGETTLSSLPPVNLQSVQTQTSKIMQNQNVQTENKPKVNKEQQQLSQSHNTNAIGKSKTANIDSLINSLLKQVEKNKIEQNQTSQGPQLDLNNNNNNKTPILDAITSFSGEFVTEYKTSINVGNEFTSNDITVQLVDDLNNTKKLYVHCYRMEPVTTRSVTLSSGQLVPAQSKIDYNNSNFNNYLRKELKKEINIPSNADINTMESYLENGSLVIKCLLKSESQNSSNLPKYLNNALSKLPDNPNVDLSKLAKQKEDFPKHQAKSSIISEFEISNMYQYRNDEFNMSKSPDSELQYATADQNYLLSHFNTNQQYYKAAQQSKQTNSNCVFENPLYNSKIDGRNSNDNNNNNNNIIEDMDYGMSKSILKANSLNLLDHYDCLAYNGQIGQVYNDANEYNLDDDYGAKNSKNTQKPSMDNIMKANVLDKGDLLMSYLKKDIHLSEEKKTQSSSKSKKNNTKKRRYKSNDCLMDDYSINNQIERNARRTSLTNLDTLESQKVAYRPRPQSTSSVGSVNNAVTKSVRFDMSNKTIQIKHNNKNDNNNDNDNEDSEDIIQKVAKRIEEKGHHHHHHHSRHHHGNHHHRSTRHHRRIKIEPAYDKHRSSKSVDHSLNGKRTSSNSLINSNQTNNLNQINKLSGDIIQDGYNCITKDGLDNIFLTYFFKLPSCSPSDRTQARIEHHNILKLKIIQEKTFSTLNKTKKKPNGSKKTNRHHLTSSSRTTKSSKNRNNKSKQEIEDSTTMQSSGSNSSHSSSIKSLLSPTLSSSSSSTSPFSNSTTLSVSSESSLSTSIESSDSLTCFNDETSKIMLREFSRQCRLPDHLFKFDETGVTVSFVNNVWVRVEIPIIDFLEPIIDFNKSTNTKKKQINEKQYDTVSVNNINSSSGNNLNSKHKSNINNSNSNINNNSNTAYLTNYQTESDSTDFKPSNNNAKNILNYFEDKTDTDVQI